MSDIKILQQTHICAGLLPTSLEKLFAVGKVKSYQQDEIVFQEGDRGRDLYIVLQGSLDVLVDPAKTGAMDEGSTDLKKIYQIERGDSFGELALIGEKPRAASVVCAQDDTRVLVITFAAFNALSREHPDIGYQLVRNIAVDMSEKIRQTNALVLDELLANYYVRVLYEELAVELGQGDVVTPVEKSVIIRDPRNFILSHTNGIVRQLPEKEDLQVFFFSAPGLLNRLVEDGVPTGEVILNVLFSLIRSGKIPPRCDARHFSFQLTENSSRRSGQLIVHKSIQGRPGEAYTLQWELKGAHYVAEEKMAVAALFVRLHTNEKCSANHHVQELIDGIDMPVQRHMVTNLGNKVAGAHKFRVFTIHHRTHEVAQTLRSLHKLGFQLDTFIGIPYGEINWRSSLMLDAASNHNYMCLKSLPHPTAPTRYVFDFMQSSFLSSAAERKLVELYANPNDAQDYLSSMQALITHRLEAIIRKCRKNGERLLIYEDGAYAVPLIYHIYHDPGHRLHPLIKAAVDERIIAGAVEVTTAGDRKNRAIMRENQGHTLLPVLSTAREELKVIYEAIGVAEAVIGASATALGNLGLPTFLLRRVAVLGGNGAIGVRLIEQMVLAHYSTSNVFSVDIADYPPARPLPDEFEYARTKVHYQAIDRYLVADDCLPVVLDMPLDVFDVRKNLKRVRLAVDDFLAASHPYNELALTNSYPLPAADMSQLWAESARPYRYELVETAVLPNNKGSAYTLGNGAQRKRITFLAPHLILNFHSLSRLIENGIDTVIGITGIPTVFQEKDLDVFFSRRNGETETDTLILASGSSKDYEFKRGINFLDKLLAIQAGSAVAVPEQLAWFASLYQQKMSFLVDKDFESLQDLFANPVITPGLVRSFIQDEPALAQKMGITGSTAQTWLNQVASYITYKIRANLTIRKELRADIGSIYTITIHGMRKRIVLLADGFVVNFYARYEKGVKTEYIDPIVTMQMLGLIALATAEPAIEPGLYAMREKLGRKDMQAFWSGLDEKSRPLPFDN